MGFEKFSCYMFCCCCYIVANHENTLASSKSVNTFLTNTEPFNDGQYTWPYIKMNLFNGNSLKHATFSFLKDSLLPQNTVIKNVNI